MYNLLRGVRVLDLTAVVLGPYATQFLGDLGADVIKVEPPKGDIFRYVRPSRTDDMGAGYLNFNRNKRSVCLNLKEDAGRAAFFGLLENADVLVHNMRPQAADRLGLGQSTITKKYPNLVYCVAAGYGVGGRNAEHPAYDDIIQGASGLAHLNANQAGEPRFLPTILCDKVGGMHLAMAVLAGIAHQAKTGKGCFIEAPMYESIVSFLMTEQLAGQTFLPPTGGVGYDRLLSPHRKPFKTKDGFIGVLPYNGKHWAAFLSFVGRDDIAMAEWVQDSAARSENVDTLYEIVSDEMPKRTTSDWLDKLQELDIPCTPIRALSELFEDGHLSDVELFEEIVHPTEGRIRSIRSPFRVTGLEKMPDRPAPTLGNPKDCIAWSTEPKSEPV